MLKALKNATASSLNFLSQSAVRLSSTFWTGLVYHGCEPLTAGAQSNQVSLKKGHLRWRLIWQLARGPWFRPVTSPMNECHLCLQVPQGRCHLVEVGCDCSRSAEKETEGSKGGEKQRGLWQHPLEALPSLRFRDP